jgi:hypothetical protein
LFVLHIIDWLLCEALLQWCYLPEFFHFINARNFKFASSEISNLLPC